jgi:hypothetical protein
MVPFHDLWIDGGETEKRPPCPQRVIEPAKIMEAISETRHQGLIEKSRLTMSALGFYER